MSLQPWKKLSEELVHESRWISYKHDRFETAAGKTGDYFYLDGIASVMVVPVTAEGNIRLVNQYRYLGDKESIEFACGNVRRQHPNGSVTIDDPLTAAHRELAEECGVAGDLTLLGKYSPCNGFIKEWSYVYLARNLQSAVSVPDENEAFEQLSLRPEEVDAKIASGNIWDGMTIVGWALARPHILT